MMIRNWLKRFMFMLILALMGTHRCPRETSSFLKECFRPMKYICFPSILRGRKKLLQLQSYSNRKLPNFTWKEFYKYRHQIKTIPVQTRDLLRHIIFFFSETSCKGLELFWFNSKCLPEWLKHITRHSQTSFNLHFFICS